MPLPTPNLDDRRFQEIVDQAKRLIPRYCPEWTDHNVSDPGVALIELFAWMTDMLLYRVNQVPDKMYVKFLDLIGVRLHPPRAARAAVTFYLSAPQPVELGIPEGTEVATIRTETSPAIIFTTEANLTLRPPVLKAVITRNSSRTGDAAWTHHDLRELTLPGRKIAVFPTQPGPGDGLYLGLEADHSHHVLALVIECETAGGAGVNPENPPIEWQVWQGGLARWEPCIVEFDGTGGFNQNGEVILRLPAMATGSYGGVEGYWLRCRLTDAQGGKGAYKISPDVESLRVETRGGTVSARHAVTVRNELLGRSEGVPGEQYHLLHTPLLARDPERDVLLVGPPAGEVEEWHEVSDFGDSGPEDRHFTLDSLDGTLMLGPSLPQPDGTMYQFGATPVKDSILRFARYQHGGGVGGNVPPGTLSVPKSSIPYVARVTNHEPATGGQDAQSLEDAKLRAPQFLRTRTRAVTADDYEHLAEETAGVARAACLVPGTQPGASDDPRPGHVVVVLLPVADASGVGSIAPEALTLSADLRGKVLSYLDERRPIGASVEVRQPQYVWVSVEVKVRVPARSLQSRIASVREKVEAALYRYLNPFTGGPAGEGWPFGRDLHLSEIYGVVQRVDGVEFVEEVRLLVSDPGTGSPPRAAPPLLDVPPGGLICSYRHQVTVT